MEDQTAAEGFRRAGTSFQNLQPHQQQWFRQEFNGPRNTQMVSSSINRSKGGQTREALQGRAASSRPDRDGYVRASAPIAVATAERFDNYMASQGMPQTFRQTQVDVLRNSGVLGPNSPTPRMPSRFQQAPPSQFPPTPAPARRPRSQSVSTPAGRPTFDPRLGGFAPRAPRRQDTGSVSPPPLSGFPSRRPSQSSSTNPFASRIPVRSRTPSPIRTNSPPPLLRRPTQRPQSGFYPGPSSRHDPYSRSPVSPSRIPSPPPSSRTLRHSRPSIGGFGGPSSPNPFSSPFTPSRPRSSSMSTSNRHHLPDLSSLRISDASSRSSTDSRGRRRRESVVLHQSPLGRTPSRFGGRDRSSSRDRSPPRLSRNTRSPSRTRSPPPRASRSTRSGTVRSPSRARSPAPRASRSTRPGAYSPPPRQSRSTRSPSRQGLRSQSRAYSPPRQSARAVSRRPAARGRSPSPSPSRSPTPPPPRPRRRVTRRAPSPPPPRSPSPPPLRRSDRRRH